MELFLKRGFDTTIEDITGSRRLKRSFFDYFPSKEEVVFAWQDLFADALRPPSQHAQSTSRSSRSWKKP